MLNHLLFKVFVMLLLAGLGHVLSLPSQATHIPTVIAAVLSTAILIRFLSSFEFRTYFKFFKFAQSESRTYSVLFYTQVVAVSVLIFSNFLAETSVTTAKFIDYSCAGYMLMSFLGMSVGWCSMKKRACQHVLGCYEPKEKEWNEQMPLIFLFYTGLTLMLYHVASQGAWLFTVTISVSYLILSISASRYLSNGSLASYFDTLAEGRRESITCMSFSALFYVSIAIMIISNTLVNVTFMHAESFSLHVMSLACLFYLGSTIIAGIIPHKNS